MSEPWNITAGELRHLVTIELGTIGTTNSRGQPSRTWATSVSNVNAAIDTPTGKKLEQARQLVPTATHVITIRYRGLNPNIHRINFNGRIFNIGYSRNVEERNVKEELTCTEQPAAG